MLNWFLIFLPVAAGLHAFFPHQETWIFITSALAIIPLAGWLGTATEHLAEHTGEAAGGLLNATFGNAAEMIIALAALRKGLFFVVKASLTGSIIGNVLLVMGASILAGGIRYKTQKFNAAGARVQSTMLTLAAVSLIVPAAFHYLSPGHLGDENGISRAISAVLLITYALSLWFSLHTHRQFFISGSPEAKASGPDCKLWSVPRALGLLALSTVLIAWLSELLVGSVEEAAHQFGMSSVFVGVIVVAVVGNAAEHSTAMLVAMKNRMDLALSIAVGSSIQVALFVAPVLVFASYYLAPQPMSLVFTPAEVLAVVLAVALGWQISADGESNWLEGVQLIAVYIILGIVFFFLPEPPAAAAVKGR